MYELINANSGKTIAVVEGVLYIRVKDGIYTNAKRENATGVAYDSKPYNLFPHKEIEGADTVIVREARVDKIFKEQEELTSISFVKMHALGQIDDITASEHASCFQPWVENCAYKAKEGDTPADVVEYNGLLYRCVQSHTSQAGWQPPETPALWTNIADPSVEYPEWSRPIGAHDAYPLGAKVSHNGKKWVSTVDNNVWEPSVYGWEEVGE